MDSQIYGPNDRPPLSKWIPLSFQHVFAMFGATILVPILTGLSTSTALFTAGTGTLIYILITGAKVPAFLGSSFAFIPALVAIGSEYGVPYAMGGAMFAGLFYAIVALIIKFTGKNWLDKALPPVVIGSVIVVIGLNLAPTAINQAMFNNNEYSLVCLSISAVTLLIAVVASIFFKGFFNTLSILFGLIGGYLFTLIMGFIFPAYRFIDFSAVKEAKWFALPFLQTGADGSYFWMVPKFNIVAILTFIIVSLAKICEHLGDTLTTSKVVGKDFYKDPGLHRTLLGDGVATAWAALWGGPPNTTYGENTGVLELSKVYDPKVIRLAAVYAIVLSFIPKMAQVIGTMPSAIIGGISFILYGMISAIGIRNMVENQVDFTKSRNLIIAAVIMVCGLGLGDGVTFNVGSVTITLTALAIASIVGIILNAILPGNDYEFGVNPKGDENRGVHR